MAATCRQGTWHTLLWRRVLRQHGSGPSLRDFTGLGLCTVPVALVVAVLALWATLHAIAKTEPTNRFGHRR